MDSPLIGIAFTLAGFLLLLLQILGHDLLRAYAALVADAERHFGHDTRVFPDA